YVDELNYKKVNDPIESYGTLNVITKSVTRINENQEFPSSQQIERIHYDYILGNPPFIGSKIMTQFQRDEVANEFENMTGTGVLDYVTAWYVKAAKLIQNKQTKCAFVSTNSITQGEQVGILWNVLINMYGIKIHFAHRTFKWSNEAKGNAAVYCVIIGFANYDTNNKSIFEYEDIKGEAHELKVKNINPYLVDAKDIFISKRSNSICDVPKIKFGNQPIDGGWLILDEQERNEAVKNEPFIEKYIRRYYGSEEFINGRVRFCLWFETFDPTELKSSKFLMSRIGNVRKFRLESDRKDTQKLAGNPTQFAFKSHVESEYIIIPSVSSERRKYIPIGFMPPNVIASNLCLIIPNAKLFHFGILTSLMHMAWVKNVCGRLKSDFRYSNGIVYNNFPWPENPTDKQKINIEERAQTILNLRAEFSNSKMADLYEPDGMPPSLVKAHNELDKAVDLAYRSQPFTSEANRMVFLFELYGKYTADLFATSKKKVFKITKHDDRK
ncbi:MAG: class I SAM-dependent DNA methyltransferase, partial [Bacteroidota bacterium]|nr:class I SAM-dependent DNA methyltransferase [Bacteroidota bacterium]